MALRLSKILFPVLLSASGWSIASGQAALGSTNAGSPPAVARDVGGREGLSAWSVRSYLQIDALDAGLPSSSNTASFGCAVATLGDLDGNGVVDLAVGAVGDDRAGSRAGSVTILFLDQDGAILSTAKILGQSFSAFGTSLSELGDLDGDGLSELAVAELENGQARGAVWVFFLEPSGQIRKQQKIGSGQGGFGSLDANDFFGSGLDGLGDLDGDGVGDLAVGAIGDDDGATDAGAVWVLFLHPDGTVKASTKISASAGGFSGHLDANDNFGLGVAGLGDQDGDGVRDLAVGAYLDDDGGVNRGAVWVLFLEEDGSVKAHQKISRTQGSFTGVLQNESNFGGEVESAGDLDGDGIGDLAVGAFGTSSLRGAVWLLFLRSDGTVRAQQKIDPASGGPALQVGDFFGYSVAIPGDLDGDGVLDLAVGAIGAGPQFQAYGALWLLELDGIASLAFANDDSALRTPLRNGQVAASERAFGRTIELSSTGRNLGPALFDSTPGGPNDPGSDPDLLVDLGNLLVLQDSSAPMQSAAGIFDQPGDDPDGGVLRIDFLGAVLPLSLDLVDIDFERNQGVIVTLFGFSGKRTYSVPGGWTEDVLLHGPPGYRTLDLTTLDPQPGFHGFATAQEDPGFDATAVLAIEVELGGSGALDNLRWDPHPDS